MRILIIENDYIKIDIFKESLFAHELIIVNDLNTLSNKLISEHFDLIFMSTINSNSTFSDIQDLKHALFAIDSKNSATPIIIHSMNPIHSEMIYKDISVYTFTFKIPFYSMPSQSMLNIVNTIETLFKK